MKEWELDWNMIEGEDVGALFQQEAQHEEDIEKIKSDYDAWIQELQNT